MPNSQIYRVFLEILPEPPFLFAFRQDPLRRPKKGDVLTNPLTFEEFKILRDVIPLDKENAFRGTSEGEFRITDTGDFRVTGEVADDDDRTHNYFVTPANNPNRIASWSRSDFEEDQTLQQLFR